jgi:hypothetical protein
MVEEIPDGAGDQVEILVQQTGGARGLRLAFQIGPETVQEVDVGFKIGFFPSLSGGSDDIAASGI